MENTNYSIAEEYELPSKGLIYSFQIDPKIRIKSMTTLHEKKLLSLKNMEASNKVLSEIIDDCIVDKQNFSSYDLAMGDFIFLLFKMRIVTFGESYPISTRCPKCTLQHEETLDLDKLNIFSIDEDWEKKLYVKLPKCGKEVKLKLITPRLKDKVQLVAKEIMRKTNNFKENPAFTVNLEHIIDTVDGEKLSPPQLTSFVEKLNLMDGRVLSKAESNIKIGLDTSISSMCPFCMNEYNYSFPFTGEFLNPSF